MLELLGLSVGYGRRLVLRNLTVRLARGRLTAVVGVNGSGKSTLLRTVLGALTPKEGRLLLDGIPLESLTPRERAGRIAYLAQGNVLPDMTVGALVLQGRFPYLTYPHSYREEDREAARRAIGRMGLTPYTEAPLATLSGGMRQNAYLAMALSQEADYILLDEPTTYLDIAHQLTLMATLRTLAAEGKGAVVVTHDLPLAFSYADEVAVLSGGTVVAQAPPAALAGSPLLGELFGAAVEAVGEGRYAWRPL